MWSSILSIIANLLGLAKDRQEEVNSPAMQANKGALVREKIRADAEKAVESGDVGQIRKDVS